MGIDVYAKWDGMTDEEQQAQYTGFSIVSGHTGYLREAYHGEPYATRVLFPECFDEATEGGIREDIPDEQIARFEEWWSKSIGSLRTVQWDPLKDVVEKMREFWGDSVEYDGIRDEFTRDSGYVPIPAATLRERLPQAINATSKRYASDPIVADAVASVVKFVELYEKLEAEGKHPRVYVSY